MKNLFVPYALALKAKEAGFDEETLGHYLDSGHELLIMNNKFMHENHTKAPIYQQIIDWFREKHNISIELEWSPSYEYDKYYNEKDGKTKGKAWSDAIWEITFVTIKEKEWDAESPDFQRADGKQLTYYSAMNVAIEKAFELIKK